MLINNDTVVQLYLIKYVFWVTLKNQNRYVCGLFLCTCVHANNNILVLLYVKKYVFLVTLSEGQNYK